MSLVNVFLEGRGRVGEQCQALIQPYDHGWIKGHPLSTPTLKIFLYNFSFSFSTF